MSQELCVKGPFKIIRGCAPNAKYQKEFWEGVEKTVPYLVNAKGAYVFSLRNGSNYLGIMAQLPQEFSWTAPISAAWQKFERSRRCAPSERKS
jgi:hypothetical protein